MGFKLVDVSETLAKLDSLFGGDGAINSSLDFGYRCFSPWIHTRRDVKGFARMFQDIVGNGTSRLSKNITEDVIKFEVGNSQTVLCPVFSPVSMLVSLTR